jgi:hypothetical protein
MNVCDKVEKVKCERTQKRPDVSSLLATVQ